MFIGGLAALLVAAMPPLDRAGEDGLLQAHIGQHIILGDMAAPLLLLGLPIPAAAWLGRQLVRIQSGPGRRGRVVTALLCPVGAFVGWTVATYFWLHPAAHGAAVAPGPAHLIDQLSFLAFGFVIWLGAFDPRPTVASGGGLRWGGMPWWARHIYAMATRFILIPACFIVWFATPSAYHVLEGDWSFGQTPKEDQIGAGTMMLAFEMVLFAFALVLAFIFIQVTEGRRRKEPDYEP
jgi:cytochrome c oxidase assembly factor CtaG